MRVTTHLVLIGLMGAGKTTVGRRCAERLGRGFVDTDDVVVAGAGMRVPDIFATEGEAGFRSRERTALAEVVAAPEPLVVACGGGAMTEAENRRAVRDHVVIWLQAEPDELAARVAADTERPLLAHGAPTATLTRLAAARADAYAAAADATVATDGRTVDEVTDAVLAAYAEATA